MRKVTEEELTEIEALGQKLLEIITTIGELHLNQLLIKSQLEEVTAEITQQEKRFAEFRNNERVLFEKLQEKYGTSNINIETGEILD
jgi:uncharacterized protein involved in exopolysaccharide biosynthesis